MIIYPRLYTQSPYHVSEYWLEAMSGDQESYDNRYVGGIRLDQEESPE